MTQKQASSVWCEAVRSNGKIIASVWFDMIGQRNAANVPNDKDREYIRRFVETLTGRKRPTATERVESVPEEKKINEVHIAGLIQRISEKSDKRIWFAIDAGSRNWVSCIISRQNKKLVEAFAGFEEGSYIELKANVNCWSVKNDDDGQREYITDIQVYAIRENGNKAVTRPQDDKPKTRAAAARSNGRSNGREADDSNQTQSHDAYAADNWEA